MNILIVDDQPLFRFGIINYVKSIKPDCVINEANNAEEALSLFKSIKHDYVIIEPFLKDKNGADLIKEMKNVCPELKCIIFSAHKPLYCIVELMSVGIKGYLYKSMSCIETKNALISIFQGKEYYTSDIESIWLCFTKSMLQNPKNNIFTLFSEREIQIIRLLCKGYNGKKTSDELYISISTLNNHKNHITKKMNVNNLVEIVIYAYKYGICVP